MYHVAPTVASEWEIRKPLQGNGMVQEMIHHQEQKTVDGELLKTNWHKGRA